MAQNAKNVIVGHPSGSQGTVFFAVAGTPLPTNESTARNSAFSSPGYLADTGVVRKVASSLQTIKAFGGDIVRKVESDHDVTYSFTMLETNPTALQIYHGTSNVTVTAPGVSAGTKIAVQIKSGSNTRGSWIFEYVDGTEIIRVVIADGQVTQKGDVTVKHDGALSYPVDVTCYPDASGVKAYEYLDNGIFAP
jgi:hypothetical protein